MFGYINYDKQYLYFKDFDLYKAAYCGVCKSLGDTCGQISRMGLSYDSAFLSVIFHNVMNKDVEIADSSCVSNVFKKRPMAKPDEISNKVAAVNLMLCYYKTLDDIADEKKGGVANFFLKSAFKRVKKNYPDVYDIVDRNMKSQGEVENNATKSVDISADATANMLKELSRSILADSATEYTDQFFYALGKWIYLIDALDDYDTDLKKKSFNPFVNAYGAKDKKTLVSEWEKDINFIFGTIFFDMREAMSKIKFHFNRDLIDNIVLRGLPLKTKSVMYPTDKKDNTKKTGE